MKKIFLLFFALSVFISCNSQEKKGVEKLEVTVFRQQIEYKAVQLIDVRTPEEYNEGAIPEAQLINFFAEDFNENVSKLSKDKPVYVYCKSGGRSGRASKKLLALGFEKIYDLKGGYTAWEAENK